MHISIHAARTVGAVLEIYIEVVLFQVVLWTKMGDVPPRTHTEAHTHCILDRLQEVNRTVE